MGHTTDLPLTECSSSYILSRDPHIVTFQHQGAKCQGLVIQPVVSEHLTACVNEAVTDLCSRPIQALALVQSTKTATHVSL